MGKLRSDPPSGSQRWPRGTRADDAVDSQRVETITVRVAAATRAPELVDQIFHQLLGEDAAALSPATFRVLVTDVRASLRNFPRSSPELAAYVRFWQLACERWSHPLALAAKAESLSRAGRDDEALGDLIEALAADPSLAGDFGDLGRELAARDPKRLIDVELAYLRAALVDCEGDEDGDRIRERYGELLDRFRNKPAILDKIRAIGREIDDAVENGRIPRALIRRSERRKPL